MKLTDIFKQDKLSLSFEVFPPKTDTAFDSVKHATEEIAKLSPSFMSVFVSSMVGFLMFFGRCAPLYSTAKYGPSR